MRLDHLLSTETRDLALRTHRGFCPVARGRGAQNSQVDQSFKLTPLFSCQGPGFVCLVWLFEIRRGHRKRKQFRRGNLEILTSDLAPPPWPVLLGAGWARLVGLEVRVEVSKGTRWMPRRKAPMKDVAGCDKLRGAASER